MSPACRGNLPERDQEEITEMIHDLLEFNTNIFDAQNKVKIDRPHRFGIKREGNRKPGPIVVKFKSSARKLKATH